MNDTVITILSLSASGTILAMMLLAAKPLFKNRVSKTCSILYLAFSASPTYPADFITCKCLGHIL
jgi:hypothetical protein